MGFTRSALACALVASALAMTVSASDGFEHKNVEVLKQSSFAEKVRLSSFKSRSLVFTALAERW
jgi:hypothetical protein